ncbi:hypothetical protein EI555_008162, partial [Monodon monoceros]
MYQARPLSRNLFLYTFLQNHGPGFLDDQGEGLPGVTNILEFHPVSPYSDGPHYLAMQLASIADEMELRLLLPQFVEPIRMTVYRNCRVSQDGALCPAVWAEPSAWDGLSREDSASGNCRLPCRFSEPHRIAQLVFPYSHIGLRDVLRSFMVAFTNLRENRSLWSFLTLRD